LEHPWSKREEIEPEELLEGDFIMREATSGTFNAVRETLARQNISISDLRTVIILGNAEAIALAVQEGIGVGFISQMVVERICQDKVAEVSVHGVDICRQIYIGRNNRRPATRAQTAFWNFLTAETSTNNNLVMAG
jgi:DNA-binding transcriptional LysR family regulator